MRLNGVGRCGPLLLTVSLLLLLFTHSSSSFTHATASPSTPSTHLSSSYASIDWSTLNSTTLASLPLSVISVAASTDLSSLPASACSGWRTNQIRALQSEACQGFRPECIAVIANDVIGNMTDGCVHFVSAIGVSGLSAEQLSHVSLTAIASMDASALAGLKSDACAGFTRASVHVLGNATSLFPSVGNACSGISSDCVDHMPEDGFAELTQSCTLYLQTSAISALSNAQVAHMASGPFRVMSVAQVGSLQSSTCGGLRADQVAALPDYGPIAPILAPRQCTALTTSCVTAMPVETFGGFTRDCVADLNATSFSQISSAQLGALTLNATSGMSWADLAALGPCDGLSEQQIGVLGTYQPSNDACNGFRADCMAALNPTKFAAFQPTCFNLLPNSAFTLLTSSQIGSVTPGALQGLTAGQLKSLPAGSCSGLTAAQVSLLGSLNPYDTCAGFTAECLQALDATAFGALTSSCFNHIPSAFIAAFTLAQLRSISESILSGITTAQLIKWVDQYGLDLVADIWTSPDLVDEISDDALLGFKAAIGDNQIAPKYQLTDTSVRSLSSITSLQLAYCVTSCMNLLLAMNEGSPTTPNILFLPLHSYRGLRGDQIASIPSNIFAQIGISVYSQLLSDAVSAITPSQILSVDPAVFAALNIGDLSVESGTVSVLSQAQIETVSNHQWRTQWGCSQYNNFTLDQRRWMGEAEATFHRECSGGQFPTAQPCSDDTSKFSLLVFIVSVVSSGVGTLIFSIIIYMCCLRRKGIPLLYDTDHSGSDYLSNSSSTLPVTVSSASAHRRIRSPNAYGNSDYSLRSPLHPNSQPTNFGRIHQSPVKSMAASYTSNHINDQDDIGSRF